ncbi:hypothetical protein F511_25694 [Dorcoceras hygrometricum]|uniref:Thaumatin-like protein n=1 Tax=Dorcoceras hygrometricum TaxID=472368 RepID=A0A2Z7C394_9LAMI|nr:hypothetical protein F511_25694 [Dorcoceras hygrometricum]
MHKYFAISPRNLNTYIAQNYGTLLLFHIFSHQLRFSPLHQCSHNRHSKQLFLHQTWTLDVGNSTAGVYRIWARTGCSFDGAGRGKCQTGDCDGLLRCQGNGTPPNTLAEFSLNQFNNMDFFDLSLIDGFNVPMGFNPDSGTCSGTRGVRCTGDINGECPDALRAPGGCSHPCTVFGTDQYCCYSGPCVPTGYLRFFRAKCPGAYSCPMSDGGTSTLSCPAGTNYRVVFCPS